MLIGTPKSGKTVFAMSFPKPYILDCDNNLRGALTYHNFQEEPFEYWYDNPQLEEPDPQKRWSYSCKALKEAVASEEIETVIVDGLSLLGTYLEAHLLANSKSGNGMKDLIIAGEKVMNQAMWGPFRNLMSALIMECKGSGKMFIMCCHEQTMTNDTGSVISYRPLISGSLRDNIAGFFSDCWRCETKGTHTGAEYSVRLAPKNLFQIGNSVGFKEPELKVTGQTRKQIWDKLQPAVSPATKKPNND